jgi:hypothetical protein
MMHPQPLFTMGNKRSGSTLLVNLLNLHPEVFMTHESDIVWILYQAREKWPEEFRVHPLDAPRGLNSTLETCRPVLEKRLQENGHPRSLTDAFYDVQLHIMRHGSQMDKPKDKPRLSWIGDKKPVQGCQPELLAFVRELFPQARFLHLVRDPRNVVASMVKAAATWRVVPDYWAAGPEEVLRRWAQHEQWVLDAVESGVAVQSLRLEDLCERPVECMREVYEFLDLDAPPGVEDRIPKFIDRNPNRKYDGVELPDVPEAYPLMERYGYSTQ